MAQLGAFSKLSVKLPALFAGGAAVSGGLVAFAVRQSAAARLGALGLSSQQVEAALSGFASTALPFGVAGVALAAGLGWLAARSLARPMMAMREGMEKLSEGTPDAAPELARRDEIGQLSRALRQVQESAVEAGRIRAALDGCRTAIMVCDANGRIVYVNKSLLKFFSEAQEDFRAAFPGVSAKDMLGKVLELFAGPQGVPEARAMRVALGRRMVGLTLTVTTQPDGQRLGSTIEWRELTEELRAADEVAAVVAAAAEGDFSRRVPLAGKPEALQRIATGVNEINAIVEAATDEFAAVLAGLSEGDLTGRIDGAYDGRLGELKAGLNQTLARLTQTVSGIQLAAAHVAATAVEIKAGAVDLAGRTEQSAAGLEETAETTGQLAASITQSAGRSRAATELAGEAMAVAGSGQQVVAETIAAIGQMEQSSARIAEIVTVIDGIAFQTNLLALNAAVEAARAGEAGKGFAVVASEVRTLAQRSATAAKDIKGVIANSNAQVAEGVRLVRRTGETLGKIVTAVEQVSATVSEISQASAGQAGDIAAMSRSVAAMDEATQQNAALAEQSAGAAASLAEQTQALRELADVFRFERPMAHARSLPAPAPSELRRGPTRKDHHHSTEARPATPRRRVAGGGRMDEWVES
ncbi:methyl-accepting chemotaxis protein [Bosea sp. CCNWLW174]|uniref:methyl-accepting chemotaxis protein n=1 Tax=unclassified Bosea (in: a-proteobacteria) TaxID=2653178 RepID=UPI0030150DC3